MSVELTPEVIDIINKTAENTAKRIYAKLCVTKEKERESLFNVRLYNVRILLDHYRLFKEHAEESIFELTSIDEQQLTAIEILDAMMQLPVDKGEIAVESIRNSAIRTHIVVEHIEAMLGIYEVYCEKSLKPEDLRRWDVINTLYLKDIPQGMTKTDVYNDLADKYYVSDRQIRMDVDNALIKLTALIFGIDGVRRFTQRNLGAYTEETAINTDKEEVI